MRRTFVVAACMCVVFGAARAQTTTSPAAPSRAQAGDSALEARTSSVAAELRCPVCQGLSIQDSPSELAQSMRSLVRDQLAEGKTPADVKAYFVSKYGEWILLAPAPHGINLVAYAVPVIVVLGGGALIAFAVRRWTSAPSVPAD